MATNKIFDVLLVYLVVVLSSDKVDYHEADFYS